MKREGKLAEFEKKWLAAQPIQPSTLDQLQTLIDAFGASLKDDLLTPYYPTAHDGSYGGFVEDRSGTWAIQQDSDKFIAFQARLIWTAAKPSTERAMETMWPEPRTSSLPRDWWSTQNIPRRWAARRSAWATIFWSR